MSILPSKLCPRCHIYTSLSAPVCLNCGHHYRTRFTPPPALKLCPQCHACASLAATVCLNCRHLYRTQHMPFRAGTPR